MTVKFYKKIKGAFAPFCPHVAPPLYATIKTILQIIMLQKMDKEF
jgi:hypothetical protein